MADINPNAQPVTLIGADSSGVPTNYATVGSNGALQTMPPITNTVSETGEVATAAISTFAVRKTAYTEQTSNAQRSVKSASANDTSAGTGARTIRLYYLDVTGASFTEDITMNGTAAVNTVGTNICFINKIEVLTTGSTLSNAGIITLFSTTAGGGSAVATIAATDNRTKFSHHYVPNGKTFYLTDLHASPSTQASTSGGLTWLTYRNPTVTNAVEKQFTAKLSYVGTGSANAQSQFFTPIPIVGPMMILQYVTTFSATAATHYGLFSGFEV